MPEHPRSEHQTRSRVIALRASSCRDFLPALKERGLAGVESVVSDDHGGLKKAITETLSEAAWQRCYLHFRGNALDHMPRRPDSDCLRKLRWLYNRRDLAGWPSLWIGKNTYRTASGYDGTARADMALRGIVRKRRCTGAGLECNVDCDIPLKGF